MTIAFRQQFWKLEVNLGFIWSHKYNILIINYLLNNLWSSCLTEAWAHEHMRSCLSESCLTEASSGITFTCLVYERQKPDGVSFIPYEIREMGFHLPWPANVQLPVKRKYNICTKYNQSAIMYNFVPVAVETLGSFGESANNFIS